MRRCTRNILLIFGLMVILVFLFIPYRATHIKYRVESHSLAKYKITARLNGYMFVFKYLKLKSNKISGPEADQNSYFLDKTLFLTELIIVMVLAPIDYFLFCLVLRKKKMNKI